MAQGTRQVFFFGNCLFGQGGILIDQNISEPRRIEILCKLGALSAGSKHCGGITEGGICYSWGDNQLGQLGRSLNSKPVRIPQLETHIIHQIALGPTHTAALTNTGMILSFGSNRSGELGYITKEETSQEPTLVRLKQGKTPRFIQVRTLFDPYTILTRKKVSLGKEFTYGLTEGGQVYSWGQNWKGQLGRGDFLSVHVPDVPIFSLATESICMIACGESHVLLLSVSGHVLSCGSNRFGELGLGDTKTRMRPTILPSSHSFSYISCGMFHSMALSARGQLYSWGSNSHGQLGHENLLTPFQSLPKRIDFFSHYTVLRCDAGERHSLAVAMDENSVPSVFSWGCGTSGQLGMKANQSSKRPLKIHGEWEYQEGVEAEIDVLCGGQFSFILFNASKSIQRPLLSLSLSDINKLSLPELSERLAIVFGSAASLNSSFLDTSPDSPSYHCLTNEFISGIHMTELRASFVTLLHRYETSPSLLTTLANATGKLVLQLSSFSFLSPSSLRIFLILTEVPWMLQADTYAPVLEKFTRCLVGLPSSAKEILRNWLSSLEATFMIRFVNIFNGFLGFLLATPNRDHSVISSVVFVLHHFGHAAVLLGKQIPESTFYQEQLTHIPLQQDFENWITSKHVFSFCNYPYLLPIAAKKKILEIEANAARCHLFLQQRDALLMKIRREFVFEDVSTILLELSEKEGGRGQYSLKKPLKVQFLHEDGEDYGGLCREMFYLLIDYIFNPDHGFFVLDRETYFSWFAANQGKEIHYKVIGMVLGMAIHNGIIVNIQWPISVFRVLLGKPLTLEDLLQFHPSTAKRLRTLQMMKEEELRECDLFFEVLEGDTVSELRPDGSSIPVTTENVRLFIQLYSKHVLYGSIKNNFDAFYSGFHLTCQGRAITLVSPVELELLLCGSSDLNFEELKKVAEYEGFTASSEVITWFWEELLAWNYSQKRKFLLFVTGAPRAPISGLSDISFTIQRAGPHSDRLPVAHTCFNILDLPEYNSRTMLKEKLLFVIQNCNGFGLI